MAAVRSEAEEKAGDTMARPTEVEGKVEAEQVVGMAAVGWEAVGSAEGRMVVKMVEAAKEAALEPVRVGEASSETVARAAVATAAAPAPGRKTPPRR